MKVMRTVPNFPPTVTGPANTAYELTKRLEDRGVSNKILTSYPKEERESDTSTDDLDIHRIKSSRGPLQYDFSTEIPSVLLRSDFDIIHAHSYRNAFTDTAYLVSKLRNKPFILHTHGTLLGYRKVRTSSSFTHQLHDQLTMKRVARDANAVIVSTKQEMDEAVQFGINPDTVYLITEGKNTDYYSSVPRNLPSDEFRVLFVGRIAPSRNISILIKSLEYLEDDVNIRIVGDEANLSGKSQRNSVSKLKKLAERNCVAHRVSFVGPKYDTELVEEYRSADLFAYVSSYENFSQPIVEAALSGLPVVSTPTGIAPEIIREGESGSLVSFDDPKAVADAIADIRSFNTEQIGWRLQQIAKDRFGWPSITNQVTMLYEEIINGRSD